MSYKKNGKKKYKQSGGGRFDRNSARGAKPVTAGRSLGTADASAGDGKVRLAAGRTGIESGRPGDDELGCFAAGLGIDSAGGAQPGADVGVGTDVVGGVESGRGGPSGLEAMRVGRPGYKSGFVAIVGRPNAGKSTLVNRLVGQKIAIVTSKPQTTRNRIQGIVTKPEGQIIFIDTPGLHDADSALGRQMMHEVAAALEGIDVLLLMVDASRDYPHADALLLQKAERFRGKTILALNKVDRVPKPKLLPMIQAFNKEFEFAAIVPISALKGAGCEELLAAILQQLPAGDAYFPEDQITDQPERFLSAEIVREKAIQVMYHEVPYALAVIVEKFEELPRLLRIEVTMNVERDSQKKILIGHKGEMLKKIGTEARKELEKLFDIKVYLALFVKVVPDWRENPQKVRELDWHFQLEGLSEEAARKSPGAESGGERGDE
jgi:GTP-binding protein Era